MKNKIHLMAVCLLLFASQSWGQQYWLSNNTLNNGFLGNNLGHSVQNRYGKDQYQYSRQLTKITQTKIFLFRYNQQLRHEL
jgi:hypothetical protein